MLDLFSGLGGASESFVLAGWDVTRIESNSRFFNIPHTEINDVRFLDFDDLDYFDLIWCSPPCLEFSMAYNAPKSVARRKGLEFQPNMELVLQSKKIIDYLQPEYWVIENVMGAQEFFNPILGKPTQIIKSFCLWGNFPKILMPANYHHTKEDVGPGNPLRANIRAKIPYEVSEQLRRSIEEQRTLRDYL